MGNEDEDGGGVWRSVDFPLASKGTVAMDITGTHSQVHEEDS